MEIAEFKKYGYEFEVISAVVLGGTSLKGDAERNGNAVETPRLRSCVRISGGAIRPRHRNPWRTPWMAK